MLSHKLQKGVLLIAAALLLFGAKLFAAGADSVVFQNDSTFTIEGVQEELGTEGEWLKVTKDDIDPEAVADRSGGVDNEINTEWIWRPYNVEEGWSPYSNGYWVYTNCGWMWVSYYRWGWRTCHYGRWWWSNTYGWVWSPGFVWAPAWVVWMYNDGYCGWYPVSPWVRWHHGRGYWCHGMRYKVRCWTYVEKKKFADPIPIRNPIVDPSGIKEIVSTGKVDDNMYIAPTGVHNNGPDVGSVEKVINRKFAVDNVTKYNNVKQYNDKTDDTNGKVDKRDDKKDKNTNVTGRNNDGVNNSTGTKKNDGGNNNGTNNTGKNDGWNVGSDGNNGKTNDNGSKKNDGNNGKKNDGNNGKKNDGNNQYSPPPKKYDPPPQYTPPKNDTPKQTPPKQDPPKYDPPKNDPPKQDPPKDNNNGKKDINTKRE